MLGKYNLLRLKDYLSYEFFLFFFNQETKKSNLKISSIPYSIHEFNRENERNKEEL